jgi:FkbM family methyltransferase
MTPYLAAENRGDVYLVPTWVDAGFFVRNTHKAEFVCLERVCALLREADRLNNPEVFVDVGAHIGTSVIPALTQHGFARGAAIEPDPANVRLLEANLALNGLHERVTVVRAAVSSQPGRLWFVPGRERGGWARGKLTDVPSPGAELVDVVTLDSLAQTGLVDPASTGLLWLGAALDDAELSSASVFLDHRVPVVFVLFHDAITESSAFLRDLEDNGYEHAIDLRRPSLDEPLSEWPRAVAPLAALPTFVPRKTLTDVLVF